MPGNLDDCAVLPDIKQQKLEEMKMSSERNTFALRLSPKERQLVIDHYGKDNCKNQNEFIQKAVRFYAGYVSASDNTEFLIFTLLSAIRGTMHDSENRIARLLFKLAVEVSMMAHILAEGVEISDEELHRLRGKCVNEVKRTDGKITFEKIVRAQDDM